MKSRIRSGPVEIDIFDFVEEYRHLAKQASGKHVVIHCFRREEGHSYRETENRLQYMTALLEVLDLEEEDITVAFRVDKDTA